MSKDDINRVVIGFILHSGPHILTFKWSKGGAYVEDKCRINLIMDEMVALKQKRLWEESLSKRGKL